MWLESQKPAKAALQPKKFPSASLKNGTPVVSKKKQESSDSSDSDSSSDDSDEDASSLTFCLALLNFCF